MKNLFALLRERTHSKKCILYGAGTIGRAVGFMMQRLQIPVAYYVDQNYLELQDSLPGIDIKSPYDLVYEDKNKVFVLICANNAFVTSIVDTLCSMGLEKEKEYYILNEICAEPTDYFDPLLGYSRTYFYGSHELYGFALYGDKDAEYKIITLGGSTTDDTLYGICSWPKILYDIIGRKDVCIFNGGIVGYDSAQELMKLIRDCLPLFPNLVISFSGVNEKARDKKGAYPYASTYLQETLGAIFKRSGNGLKVGYGMENNATAAQEYIKNQRLMDAICHSLDIDFITFLQPDLRVRNKSYYGEENVEMENSIHSFFSIGELEDAETFFDEIDNAISGLDFLVDGRGFLENHMDVFVDWAHVNEEGNKIIAAQIYNLIKDKLPKEPQV